MLIKEKARLSCRLQVCVSLSLLLSTLAVQQMPSATASGNLRLSKRRLLVAGCKQVHVTL